MGSSRFYLICVWGQLKPGWEDWFGGLSQQGLRGYTLLSGSLPDQSALLGVLDVIHNLGLTLISVNNLETSPAEADALQNGLAELPDPATDTSSELK